MQTRGGDSRCRDAGGAGGEQRKEGRRRESRAGGAPSPGEPARPARTRDSGPGLSALIHTTDTCREASGHSPHGAPGQRPSGRRQCRLSQPQRRTVLNVLASCRCQKLSHRTHSRPGRGEDGLAEPEGTRQNPVPQGCGGALSDARRLTCLSAAAVQQNAVTLKFKQRLSPGQRRSRALTVVSGPPGQGWGGSPECPLHSWAPLTSFHKPICPSVFWESCHYDEQSQFPYHTKRVFPVKYTSEKGLGNGFLYREARGPTF